MLKRSLFFIGASLVILSGCTTTNEAHQKISSKWIGQSSDEFFAFHGAPLTSFAQNNGGILYGWKGGEYTYTRPAKYETITQPSTNNGIGKTQTKSSTTVSQPDANTTVTKTQSSSSSFNINSPTSSEQRLVTPAKTVSLVCELQIGADTAGTIRSISVINDTEGRGLSLSRCDEILNKK